MNSQDRALYDAHFEVMRNAGQMAEAAAYEHMRPSAVWRPNLSIDGNQWCALYGTDLQSGVAGFGASPEAAMLDFDAAWSRALGTDS